jgi:hypothetical protein
MELPEADLFGASGAVELDRNRDESESKVSFPNSGRHGRGNTRIWGAKHVY